MSSLNPDLSKPTCRVCLQNSQDEDMSSIFDVDAEISDLHIYEKIEQCAGIKIIQHEKIPTLICNDCYGILRVSYKFRTICRNSNEYLKEFVVKGKFSSPQQEHISPKENPLQLVENRTNEKTNQRSQYKTRLKEKTTAVVVDSIKIEKDDAHNTPANLENLNEEPFEQIVEEEIEDEVWYESDYQEEEEDEDFEISIEAMDLEIKEENEEQIVNDKKTKAKKRSTPKEKKSKPSKTLGISSDGAAVIRERKPRAKREKKEKQPHICDICGNIYNRRYALEVHVRRHRDEKPFDCELCTQAFHSNFELIRHMRKHTGVRPYKCSYCPRAFGDQSTLIKHERIHRNERPFKCDTCGKSFTYSNVLKSHILTHTGEKPYTCELCGKCFTRAHHLRAHLETLQHQSDPRSKILLQNIKKNNEGETLKIKNLTLSL
ncbi:uncharacterized protein ACRADG_006417 [Cochliomyia hominivorax]